jgi:hypothetical protein
LNPGLTLMGENTVHLPGLRKFAIILGFAQS